MNTPPDSGVTPGGSGDKPSFRSRRRHLKSRRGCLECKRRHMKVRNVDPLSINPVANCLSIGKCDETRPKCLNCATVDRKCSYKDKGGGNDAASRASSSGPEKLRVEVEGSTHSSHSPSALPDPTPLSHQAPPACSPDGPSTASRGPSQGEPHRTQEHYQSRPFPYHPHRAPDLEQDEPHVNMVHMDLLHHFLTSTYGFVNPEQPISGLVKEVAVRHAVSSPFLMHQLLAFSARHRSSLSRRAADDEGRSERFFRHLAARLQTRAISLFGTVDLNSVTPAERVSIFLFSSFLGFQDLCDALSLRAGRFDEFMERYLAYAHLHRGMHKVITGSWEMLRESELRPVLDAGKEMFRASGTGHECDDLRQRIDAAEGLGDGDKEACRNAIRHLQWVFDARPEIRSRLNVLLAWVPMVPDGFVRLLEAGRREALCVLGYYFVLLHFCKDVWFVCDSGEYLLRLLDEYLGPEWEGWMEKPKALLEEPWG